MHTHAYGGFGRAYTHSGQNHNIKDRQ